MGCGSKEDIMYGGLLSNTGEQESQCIGETMLYRGDLILPTLPLELVAAMGHADWNRVSSAPVEQVNLGYGPE